MPGVRAICSPWGTWDQDSRKSSGSSGAQVQVSQWIHMKDSRKSSGSRRSPGTGDPVDPYGKTKKKQSGTKRASGLMQEETTLLPVLLTVKQVKKTTLSCLHTYGPRRENKKESSHMPARKCGLTNTRATNNTEGREFSIPPCKTKNKIKHCHRVHLT